MVTPYIVVFFLNLFGGGIATFGVGLALRTASLNFFGVFVAIILADTLSDVFYYCVGRFASHALQNKFIKQSGKGHARFSAVESYFEQHGKSTVFLAKMSDVLAIPAVVLAGAVKMPFPIYLLICSATTVFKTALILGAGYLLSRSADPTDAHFVLYGISGLFLVVLVIVLMRFIYKEIMPKR